MNTNRPAHVHVRPGRRPGYAELYFAKAPDEQTQRRLRAERFRFSARFRGWYGPGMSAQRIADEINRTR